MYPTPVKSTFYLTYKTVAHNEMRLAYHVQFLRLSATTWFHVQDRGHKRLKGNEFFSKRIDIL